MNREIHVRICGGRRLRCRRLPGRIPGGAARLSTRRSRSWGTRSAPAGPRIRMGRRSRPSLPAVSAEALKAMGLRVRSWRIHMRTGDDLGELAGWINPIVAGWMELLRPVLPVRTVSLPAAHQHLPDALGAAESTSGCAPTSVQPVVDRAHRSRARTVRPLGAGRARSLKDEKSRMTGDCHVRFRGSPGVRFRVPRTKEAVVR